MVLGVFQDSGSVKKDAGFKLSGVQEKLGSFWGSLGFGAVRFFFWRFIGFQVLGIWGF